MASAEAKTPMPAKAADSVETGVREAGPRPRLKSIERRQLLLRTIDVERLVADDHPVRAIWQMIGQLDLTRFCQDIEAVEGEAGRSAWDPQLLISLWIYAYSQGVGSARELSRLCEYHPAYQWLTGMEVVNYHSLSDFRIRHQLGLDQLFVEVLGVLSEAGLIGLKRVMHDGTKVKAYAADNSFRREPRLRAHLELARQQVEQMGDPRSEELSQRVAQARQRALREKQQRLKSALEQLEQIRAVKPDPEQRQQARASWSDPEARIMQQAHGGYAPAYNLQISTDASPAKVIVGMGVSQAANDAAELQPAVARIETNLGQVPPEVVIDEGFTNKESLEAMAQKQVEVIGPVGDHSRQTVAALKSRGVDPKFFPQAFVYDQAQNSYICPAGKTLAYEGKETQKGALRYRYRAQAGDCRACPFKTQCCPDSRKGRSLVRTEDSAAVAAFKAKMQTSEAKAIYKQRAGVAEFPNAWIKAKIGLRQFRLRGLIKVRLEALWACLTYNLCQWIRLCWRPQRLAAARP